MLLVTENPTERCDDVCFRKISGNFAEFHGNAYSYFVFQRLSEATQNGARSRKFEIAKNRLAIGLKKHILKLVAVCPVRLEVRTSGFHPENRSSILLRDARLDFKKISDPERFYQHFFGDQAPFFACLWTAAVFERCVSPFFLDKGGNLPGSGMHLKLTFAL